MAKNCELSKIKSRWQKEYKIDNLKVPFMNQKIENLFYSDKNALDIELNISDVFKSYMVEYEREVKSELDPEKFRTSISRKKYKISFISIVLDTFILILLLNIANNTLVLKTLAVLFVIKILLDLYVIIIKMKFKYYSYDEVRIDRLRKKLLKLHAKTYEQASNYIIDKLVCITNKKKMKSMKLKKVLKMNKYLSNINKFERKVNKFNSQEQFVNKVMSYYKKYSSILYYVALFVIPIVNINRLL